MRALRALLASSAILLLATACTSSPVKTDMGAFVRRELTIDGVAHRYQVFVPSPSAGGRKPPVILSLHGIGERGSDGDRQVQVGLGSYVRKHAADFPAIVVFAQAPDDHTWKDDTAAMALAELDQATDEFHGDRDRTYLTGLSMGGYGTWELALLQPGRFAALVPVCGALLPPGDGSPLFVASLAGVTDPYTTLAKSLHGVPVWIFHGAQDDVVPPNDDRRIYAALQAAGADVHYTEFPEAKHNSWDPAYATPELWAWLFAQHRR